MRYTIYVMSIPSTVQKYAELVNYGECLGFVVFEHGTIITVRESDPIATSAGNCRVALLNPFLNAATVDADRAARFTRLQAHPRADIILRAYHIMMTADLPTSGTPFADRSVYSSDENTLRTVGWHENASFIYAVDDPTVSDATVALLAGAERFHDHISCVPKYLIVDKKAATVI